ncbi:MAG TPA: hypothetical protein VK914_06025 [bacterium]|jgi:hypothetical protein|nr:hypothetical protein [bacterium]
MTPLLPILYAVFIGLALIWPLAFFGYRFYVDLVAAETEKHAKQAPGH